MTDYKFNTNCIQAGYKAEKRVATGTAYRSEYYIQIL